MLVNKISDRRNMESIGGNNKLGEENEPTIALVTEKGVKNKGEEKDVETESLLRSAVAEGGTEGKRRRSLRRKVQWNDRNGNKLVEVLEFHPSDSSDSDDDYIDTCICIVM